MTVTGIDVVDPALPSALARKDNRTMGSTAIPLISTLTALNLGHAVLQIVKNAIYERSRRATLVAVLSLAREDAVQLLVHHNPVNCDVRVVHARPSATLPDHLTGP